MDRTRYLFFGMVGLTFFIIFVGLLIEVIRNNGGSNNDGPMPPDATTPVNEPERGVEEIHIEMWTNDTKANWVKQVAQMFNDGRFTTASGKRIVVKIEQMDSGDIGPRLIETDRTTAAGPTIISPGTIAWVNEADVLWRDLHQGQALVSGDCPPLAYAPIGFGLWQRMAEAMGWPDTPIGWQEIVDLAADPEGWARYEHPEWGQFKFGHTDPHSSNTGLAAMTSFVYATLGQTEGLTPALVRSPEVAAAFAQLENNTYHYGSSTRSLNVATAILGKAYLHATASSENGILATNFYQRDKMEESLVFIFPKEGAFWAENPFCVVNTSWVTAAHQEAAAVFLDFLLSREAQQYTVDGWLRPVNPDHMPEVLPDEWQYTDRTVTIADVPPLETNTSGDTTAAVQDVFNQAKKKATIIVVLDRSHSMQDEGKMAAAIAAAHDFLSALDKGDEVQMYLFNDQVTPLQPLAPAGEIVETLQGQIDGMWAEGNTALYDVVCQAKETAELAKTADEEAGEKRLYGIVLLSDGEDTNSQHSESEMFTHCVPRSEGANVVKIFTIAYGTDADELILARLATRTNGKAYTADAETIDEVLQEIVWEQ